MFDRAQHCRIARVRMKGGADITLLRKPDINPLGEKMIEHTRVIAGSFGDRIAGFFVVGFAADGEYSCDSRMTADSCIPLTLLPSWLEEVARRELVTDKQIHVVMERDFIITPPSPKE